MEILFCWKTFRFARRRGRDHGAGQCLWADHFALETIADRAGILLLIYDEQGQSRGSRSGQIRGGAAAPDPRFVACGELNNPHAVLLHRSRRMHYNPILFEGTGVVDVNVLPPATRALWPGLAASKRHQETANASSHSKEGFSKRQRV